jgi:hypothetical protein
MPGTEFAYTGSQVTVFLNGTQADLLQTIRGADSYGHQPVRGIGDGHAKEFAPGEFNHQITIDRMALRHDSLVSSGVIPRNGDAVMQEKPFTIEIFSKDTGAIVKKYMKCICDQATLTVQGQRIVISDAVFMAVDTDGDLNA